MQQKLLQKLALAIMTWAAVPVAAYDFEVGGFYYKVLSSTNLTCAVTNGDKKYTGDVVIPSSVTYKNKTFSVTTIANDAFMYSDITNVTIPNSVKKIDGRSFWGCNGLTSIVIPNSVDTLIECSFPFCSNLKTVKLPNSITKIGWYTFRDDTSLQDIVIPNSVTIIDNDAFSGCSSLPSIIIPTSVTKIGNGAFDRCSSLTTITIPSSVTSMGSTFSNCNGLTSVYSLGTTPPAIIEETFTGMTYIEATLYVPEEALAAYKDATGWKNFWNIEAVETTGIDGTEAASEDAPAAIYDLQGRRLDEPQKGINIIGGKKMVVK